MYKPYTMLKWLSLLLISLMLTNCGGGGGTSGTAAILNDATSVNTTSMNDTTSTDNGTLSTSTDSNNEDDEFSRSEYRGLNFYYKNMPSSEYRLPQLTDANYNRLNETQKLQIADKLLSTLFFGYPLKVLQEKIASGSFIESIRSDLEVDNTDKEWLENYIINEDIFRQSTYNEQVAVDILTRFYAMKKLDGYFIKNWTAYILTQTIMFSPAYELESTHTPNIARVYNRLVTMLGVESGMRYITYVHMMSEDNWRRFRSPEDNGREMMEIFTLDMDDSHVPLAGQALKNWKLDRDHDTLVVSLNENRQPLSLFGTTIYNGDDFYREMAKSDLFTKGVTTRLVSFFFPNAEAGEKAEIINAIVSSSPETWQDILLQIVFSEEYLLHSNRAKSAEELFFSVAKKTDFKHRTSTFHELKDALEEMHQASMKYKLGKLKRVPLDTLSFANYHKYIRERILLRKSNHDKETEYDAWDRQGWDESFIANENFNFDEGNEVGSLHSLIHYLFKATVSRTATSAELALFGEHMLVEDAGEQTLHSTFDMFRTNDDPVKQEKYREDNKRNIAVIVLDYISRLSATYTHKEVK